MFRPDLSAARGLVILAAGLCLPGFSAVNAAAPQDDRLPGVAWVLERYVTATGGREALLRHTSMTIHGRYQMPAVPLDVELVLYTKDGKSLQVATLPTGKSRSGYDGHIAWDLDSHGKVTIHHGEEVLSIARDADMYYHLHVMRYFRSLKVLDVQSFNGRQCYHLKGFNNWNQSNEHFYDKETGLLVGYRFNTAWRGGSGPATAVFEDYRDFGGGVLMPTKTTTRDGSDLSIFTITSVTWDNVPDAIFALPAAVRAKLKD